MHYPSYTRHFTLWSMMIVRNRYRKCPVDDTGTIISALSLWRVLQRCCWAPLYWPISGTCFELTFTLCNVSFCGPMHPFMYLLHIALYVSGRKCHRQLSSRNKCTTPTPPGQLSKQHRKSNTGSFLGRGVQVYAVLFTNSETIYSIYHTENQSWVYSDPLWQFNWNE